jgi:hypothetical protein
MKNKYLILVILLIISGTFTFQSCTEEEGTITTYGAFTQPVLVAPANDTYLDVAGTTVDLKWSSTDAEGDPEKWDIYFGTSHDPDLVKTDHNSQTYTVTVAKGNEYFWRVVGTDAIGIPTRSETWSFKIIDPAAEMYLGMSWETDIATSIGLELDPEEAVDMRLLIVSETDESIVEVADGASALEEIFDFNTLADGTYLIAADIYSTVNAGDFNAPVAIDIDLVFDQPGIVSETFVYPQVMTNIFPCDAYRTYLAKVVKAGTVYTVTKEISYMTPQETVWYGTDATFDSEVTTVVGCDLLMNMLGNGWMFNWWGEIIVEGGTLKYTVDASGNVTIPFQYYCSTTYNGAPQPDYAIQGSGTLNTSGAYPVMTLHYDFNQGGTWIGHYSFLHYGWEQDGFDAVITTDPNGKGAKGASFTRPPRPNR